MAFDQLKSSQRSVEVSPQAESTRSRGDVKYEGNATEILARPNTHRNRSEQRNEDGCRN
jgi:hypothetical protein